MLNESLCNEDHQKQAHLTQVDFYIKRLFSFNRLSVEVYEKLLALRDEEAPKEGPKAEESLDRFLEGDGNFFLD